MADVVDPIKKRARVRERRSQMREPEPLPYGRDRAGRFAPGNSLGKGRAHAFARQAAQLRKAFYDEVTPADMRALVRKLVTEATGGNLQAARLLLLWLIGKPSEAHHPDAVEAMLAAEVQAATPPPPLPVDPEARLDWAARELAQEMRACRGLIPEPGEAVEVALEDLDRPL
jgi:hypothetical protein